MIPRLGGGNQAGGIVTQLIRTRLIRMVALGSILILAGPVGGSEHDGVTPEFSGGQAGIAIFGERLMRYRVLPEGGGSGHFDPPLPLDDKEMLLAAMKAVARAVYGDHRIDVEDKSKFNPRIGRASKVGGLDYDYTFLLDGSRQTGVSDIQVRRKEVERTIDEQDLLKALEAL